MLAVRYASLPPLLTKMDHFSNIFLCCQVKPQFPAVTLDPSFFFAGMGQNGQFYDSFLAFTII